MALAVSVTSAPFWFWWVVPVVLTGLVVVTFRVLSRDRRPKDGSDAVEDFARFRDAMTHIRQQQKPDPGSDGEQSEDQVG